MTDKIVVIILIIALMPLFFWLGKTIVYIALCKFFGVNVTYKEDVDGVMVTKKVRVNSKTSYEELVALYKKTQQRGKVQ
ncbi:hypothetical protein CWB99_15895 [Pseudoalteromonas rubra]|uniref:Uncharacterized protein n=1 Tax=Pseudoalteromonas rubra TaxID=43658 RepID=A0A5S3WIU1_9GAMM|nr:hypothetical protein [Pseudoalteromonas rubra]TMP27198.1 hypothetical protein CWB99_15895 [Pseudoalteromonas rubra]TMP29494.1 hypothetical protein CWC00_18990 [Pseudoalteromonas rubra]